ncbi:MAG TPA: PD-(D/E)XK nuclease family protein [Marinagarivorans sp.]
MEFLGLEAWFKALHSDAFICTPNQRLMRFYQTHYQRQQRAAGRQSFAPLNCMALELWQSELLRKARLSVPECAAAGVPLAALQKRLVWQRIVDGDETLWAAGDVLDSALEADKWLAAWGINPEHIEQSTEEFTLWLKWRAQYTDALAKLARDRKVPAVIDEQVGSEQLLALIASGDLKPWLPKVVVFTGFDQWPAPLKRLAQALTEAGVDCQHHRVLAVRNSAAQRVVLASPKSELFAAAQWALAQSEQGRSVAVVVPDLGQRLADVERVFQQVFDPLSQLPNASFDSRLINISSGQPLMQCPLISTALRLLAWSGQSTPMGELKTWLLSPMVGNFGDLAARTALLSDVASTFPTASLAQLKAAVAERNNRAEHCTVLGTADAEQGENHALPSVDQPLAHFAAVLEAVHHHIAKSGGAKRKPSQWLEVFRQRLDAWGWPGSRTLTSTEYQQHEHWLAALNSFALLDDISTEVDLTQALRGLTQILKAPFHKQTPPAKVQILGVLEATGQLFDGVWWLGLDSHTWPEPLKLNPLLPAALQRDLKMPRSHAGAELSYAKSITDRLCRSAPEVIVSHAAYDGDAPLNPSPLIEALPALSIAEPSLLHPWQAAAAQQKHALQRLNDDTARALPVPMDLKGGVGVIKRQAACPFQAFAVHRLNAVNPEAASAGLDSRDRGNAMHEVLEFVWQRLESHERLINATDETLSALIEEAVAEVLAKLAKGRQLGSRLLQLEAQRLQSRVLQWLAQERQRAPFVVLQQEKTLPLELAGLRLTLRMDRVDCLADGKTLAVIDYKTGTTSVKSWQWPRIDEPQIPLYATALPNVGAAVFAQVNTQSMQYMGLTAVPDYFEQLIDVAAHKDWPASFVELLDEWRQQLQAVASAFVAGDAHVAPKNAGTCKWCDLHSLCRINEHTANQQMVLRLTAEHEGQA